MTPNADYGGRFRVLSLGAGVQSTTVLLMMVAGELEPVEVAIFADTQAEPAEVYAHLDRLTAASTIPVVRVTAGDLAAKVVSPSQLIPVFLADGGIAHRACTERFKIRPIRKWITANRAGRHVDQSFGISLDEIGRMRDSRDRWASYRYPLVEVRMTRHDCQRWLVAHGWDAPRSACYFCPYHSDTEWRRLRDDPAEWARAVAIDKAMRTGPTTLRSAPYLHRSLVPLDEVDLSTPEDHGQLNLFDQECEGMCGL